MPLKYWLWLIAAPAMAQFRSMEIAFQGVGCASCIESLPSRVQRIRGVESASVDARQGILKLTLAAENRVRIEQVRDMIEQDGTRADRAVVRVQGALSQREGKWILQPRGVAASYEVKGRLPPSGSYVVTGDIAKLRPEQGILVITATECVKAE